MPHRAPRLPAEDRRRVDERDALHVGVARTPRATRRSRAERLERVGRRHRAGADLLDELLLDLLDDRREELGLAAAEVVVQRPARDAGRRTISSVPTAA
jgi:hypothetical protein